VTPDAGPSHVVCWSTVRWSSGNQGSTHMSPGQAGVACHRTQAPRRASFFVGAAYPSAHEQTNCAALPPLGLVVELIAANGNAALSRPVRSPSGNHFSGSTAAGLALPYRARIKNARGQTLQMRTPQTSGDCNALHPEQGTSGAAGRIVWPR
jgi:hypothetical protein